MELWGWGKIEEDLGTMIKWNWEVQIIGFN